MMMGLELLKDNTLEDKMKVFFELCDTDNSGNISETELYGVLKQNIQNKDDRIKLKSVIHDLFRTIDKNGDGFLDKDELLEASKNNVMLRQLLEQSI